MATYKRIDGDYNITTLNANDNVNVTTDTVVINGNLKVAGNVTYIDVTELNVTDPFIALNVSNTGSYSSNSGVLTHKTSSEFAGFRYNNTAGFWEISVSTDQTGLTGLWETIATANSAAIAAGSNTQIQFNNSGVFGASDRFTFDKDSGAMTLQGHEALGNLGVSPAAVANSVVLYHKAQTSGGAGIYAKTTTTDSELIGKTQAIVYSLIF